jgi:hypothetical protein
VSALGLAAALLLAPRPAIAQIEGGTSGLGITINSTVKRFFPNGTTPYNFRAGNFNPSDINFQDCEDNIVLQFSLNLSGLPTTDTVQVWAGATDCSQATARETGTGPYCWLVSPSGQFANSTTSVGNIYARNISRYLDSTTTAHFAPVTDVPGIEACHTQTTSGAIQLSLYFIFLKNDGITADAVATYGQNVDMVGPQAPTLQLPLGIGDGMLLINWQTAIDSTIQGFQVFAQDQGAGGLGLLGDASATLLTTPIYCMSGGTCVGTGSGSGSGTTDASASDGAADTSVADASDGSGAETSCTMEFPDGSGYTEVSDASALSLLNDADLAAQGCIRSTPVNTVSSSQASAGGTCSSTALVDYFTTSVTTTYTTDGGLTDGATSIVSATSDGGTTGGTGTVGISQIDAAVYGVGNVGGNMTSSYIITSIPLPDGGSGPLINGHQYAVAVAAYDDDLNVGAVSNLGCQTPAPVTDFWDRYKDDGGLAGGGFCSLEAPGAPVAGSVLGLGMGAAVVALGRRRRRRSS